MPCSCFATWADDLVTQPIFTAGMYLGQMIELRTLTDADVEAHNHGEDAEVVRWLTGDYGTDESTRRHFSNMTENALRGEGKRGFGVWFDRRLAGYIDCDPTFSDLPAPGDVNIAYSVHPWARRQGVASAAIDLICTYIAEEKIGDRAVARIEPGNTTSIGVIEKCGFQLIDSDTLGPTRLDSAKAGSEFGAVGGCAGHLIYVRELHR